MQATFWQKGNALDYQNNGDAVIAAGSVVSLNTRIGVASAPIAPDQVGVVHVEGVFILPKQDGVIALGAPVFWYAAGRQITTTAGSNIPAGYAVKAATAGDEVVYVKLLG